MLDDYAAKKKAKEAAGDPAKKFTKLVGKLSIVKLGKSKGKFNRTGLDELSSLVGELLADAGIAADLKDKATKAKSILANSIPAEQQLQSLKALLPSGDDDGSEGSGTPTESSRAEDTK